MRAFTLIEALVYLALSTILMAGMLVSAEALRSSVAKNERTAVIETEGSFALGKLVWILEQSTILKPSQGSESTYLAVEGAEGSATVFTSGETLMLRSNEVSYPITSNNVVVEEFLVTRSLPTATEPSCLQILLEIRDPGSYAPPRTFTKTLCVPYH